MNRPITAATMLAVLAATAPAHAEDTEKVALLSFLGLKAAEGKTEVGDKGGVLESWIAASGLMANAACTIAYDITRTPEAAAPKSLQTCSSPAGNTDLIVLGDSEKLSFGAYALVNSRITHTLLELKAVSDLCPPPKPKVKGGGDAAPLAAIDPMSVPAAVLDAAKSDIKVSGIEIKAEERAFANAFAGIWGGRTILPDGVVYSADSKIDKGWQSVTALAASVSTGPCKDKPKAKAALALFEDAQKSLFASGDNGSLFDRARAVEPLLNGNKVPDVLRVRVEYTGATLINQQNIFTTLGAPALSLSGGMVISYRLTDATNGSAKKAGLIVCRAGVKMLHSFNDPSRPVPGGTCTRV